MRFCCPRCNHTEEMHAGVSPVCPSCGFDPSSPTLALTTPYDPAATGPPSAGMGGEVPTTLGGYRLLREIGAGGMGAVFEAAHVETGRRVAVKLIRPGLASSSEAVDRFRREGRFAGTVTHPRCVFVITADEDQGRPFIVMELMPGATLKDLVAERGPLPPAEAVAKTLDVIEGLEALHSRGLIHRDVKPANCFLEASGRVKVGDFGLARSLLAEADLTQTGQFLGTPLFASPEQLKGEAVDERTDVYSVSATLYFLLTGRAPFQGGDAAVIVARVASEPAPSMRSVRPDLPRALDRVVLRGLERDRRRRWPDLKSLRSALLRFGPPRHASGDLWVRAFAYLIDYLAATALMFAVGYPFHLVLWLWQPDLHVPVFPEWTFNICSGMMDYEPGNPLLAAIPEVVYFGLLEGVFGCGLGKWLLGLRVLRTGTGRPPGVIRAALRAAAFCLLLYLPRYLPALFPLPCFVGLACLALSWWNVGGILLILSTMRERNGYRGLHDFLAGTFVTRIRWPGGDEGRTWLRRPCPDRVAERLSRPAELPAQVGPFTVRGALSWQAGQEMLVAEDEVLGRRVLLWLRPAVEPPVSAKRREVNRLTRLRWLTDGVAGPARWDAFVAEGGCPLPELVDRKKPFAWAEARPLLERLTEELTTASAEGTLPETLTPEQVWVQPDGRVLLFDAVPGGPSAGVQVDDQRALSLLGRVAVLTLEGKERPGDESRPIRAPLPLHASTLTARLLGGETPYGRLEEFQTDLAATRDRPTRVSRARRALQIVVQAGLFVATILLILGTTSLLSAALKAIQPPAPGQPKALFTLKVDGAWEVLALIPIAGVIGAALLRGGPSFGLCGIVLVRRDGRCAARWQAALRSFLAWAQGLALLVGPPGLLLAADLITGGAVGAVMKAKDSPAATAVWLGLPTLTLVGIALVVWLPRRTLPDRLAGTYLVPR